MNNDLYFFFQAEDGIRDLTVTGVQTCALPIYLMDAANFIEHEKVQVVNVNNGNRFETYLIRGKRGSGVCCMNGPSARLGEIGRASCRERVKFSEGDGSLIERRC